METDSSTANAQIETTAEQTSDTTPPMAQGTSDDSGDPDERTHRELVRLRTASEGSWVLNMKRYFDAAGFEAGDSVEFDLVWDDDQPMLMLGKLPADDVDAARDPRTVTDRGASLSINPPKPLLEDDTEYGHGLGLEYDAYDNDNPLCFDPMVDEGVIALLPVGFEADLRSHDEEPDLLVSDAAVAAAVQATGLNTPTVRDALLAVEDAVDEAFVRESLSGVVDDYELLDVGDRVVVVVGDRAWSDVQSAAGLSADVLEAVRVAHTRTAEDLVVEVGASEYRRFSREYSALVAGSA